jgi:hypothetical protein
MVEQINKKDLEDVAGEAKSAGLRRRSKRVEVSIHTMPKRFLQVPKQSSSTNKNVGLYIIIGGSVVLIVILALLYYLLSRAPKSSVSLLENKVLNTQDKSSVSSKNSQAEDLNLNKSTSPANATENNFAKQPEEIIDENSFEKDDNEDNTVTINAEDATSTDETTNTNSEVLEPVILKAAVDSDVDGLSDIEEAVLDTNPQIKDSDGDGYNDLEELIKLYNPAGGGKIIVNPNIEKYTNTEFNYSMYYPKNWIINNASGNNSIVFQLGGDEFIQVILEPKFEQATLDDWYKDQFEIQSISVGKKIFKTGWAGIKSDDSLIMYLFNPKHDYLLIVSYNPGNDILKYQNIFEMMVKSFEFIN